MKFYERIKVFRYWNIIQVIEKFSDECVAVICNYISAFNDYCVLGLGKVHW